MVQWFNDVMLKCVNASRVQDPLLVALSPNLLILLFINLVPKKLSDSYPISYTLKLIFMYLVFSLNCLTAIY